MHGASVGGQLVGWVALALAGGALAAAGWQVRARMAPTLHGPVARLAEVVVALTVAELVLQALGVVGQLRRWPVLLGVPLVAVSVAVGARCAGPWPVVIGAVRRPTAHAASSGRGRWALPLVAVGLTAVVAAQWVAHASPAVDGGFRDFDSLRYHGPFPATWIQQRSVMGLVHSSAEAQETFFPGNVELLDAYGILAVGSDVLMAVRNLAWFALAFLAAWCAGRRVGDPWVAVAGLAALCSTPLLSSIVPSSAKTDICAVALLLAATALLLHAVTPSSADGADRGGGGGDGGVERGPLLLAGLAAGLAAGTKLTVLVPLSVLAVGAVAVGGRHRWRTTLTLGAPMLATGGVWYLRNLVGTGNPLPWYRLGAGPLTLPAPPMESTETFGSTVVDYLGSASFWSTTVPEGLLRSFGPLWPVLVGGALAAAATAVVRPGRRDLRLVGAASVVAMAAYTVTPFSAGGPEGNPRLFALDLRFLAPALSLAAVAAAGWCRPTTTGRLGGRRAHVVVGAAAVAVVANQFSEAGRWPPVEGALAAAVAAFAAAGLAVALATRPPRWNAHRAPWWAVAAVLALVAVGAGRAVQDHHQLTRYAAGTGTNAAAYRALRDARDARIAVGGFALTYPLYGDDLSNRVTVVGVDLPHGGFRLTRSCTEWRWALRAGDFDYVVLSRSPVARQTPPAELAWTTDPTAEPIVREGVTTVYRLRGDGPDPADCP